VTFFIKAKNIGSGRVYDTKVDLFLMKDGVKVGGATFPIGVIAAGKGVKITTGLVLSKTAVGGNYVARAIVHGNVGPDDHKVSASSDSSFTIHATPLTQILSGTVQDSSTDGGNTKVMGMQEEVGARRIEDKLKIFLGVLAALYFAIEGVKRRRQLILAFYKASYSFRLFL